ncbi:MAG: complexin-2 [Oscillospiraceae bacterium]
MKQIQISEELFIQLVRFHLCDDDLWQKEIEQGLESKLEAMIKRNLYTAYKTAPSPQEKEQARIKYLDSVGMHRDWRW